MTTTPPAQHLKNEVLDATRHPRPLYAAYSQDAAPVRGECTSDIAMARRRSAFELGV